MSLSPITPEPESQQKQDAPDDKKTKELRGLRWRTTIGLGAAVLIGVVVAACHGGTVTASLAAFGASLGLGGVLGFLFGIPGNARPSANSAQAAIVTRPALGPGQAGQGAPTEVAAAVGGPPADSGDAGPANRVSNLEQVADWVTKLLLGGGLHLVGIGRSEDIAHGGLDLVGDRLGAAAEGEAEQLGGDAAEERQQGE